ncbi:MAG: hypothetical protein ACRDRJ_08160 [Streptosporangiaceae bacterium]
MDRFFGLDLAAALAFTFAAILGHVVTPLVASHGTGVKAAMRAGRDGEQKPPGRHRNDNVVSLHARRLNERTGMNTPDISSAFIIWASDGQD